MIDTEALRKKVIDLAIQGKLTEQFPNDGDAETLYAQILDHKLQLIKKGKIKKDKALPDIAADEIPFDIPDNWKWVRLGELCLQITDGTHRTPTYQSEGIPFLSVKNISSGAFDLTDIKYISEEEHSELIKRCKPEKNDVLVCRIGTLGKAITIDIDLEFSIFVSLGLIKTTDKTISDYIVQVINSGYGDTWIKDNKAGGAMHTYKINLNSLALLPVPLAPISEIERILQLNDEVKTHIENIYNLQAKYRNDLAVLKSKIIDSGIQGKLTEQLSEDGDAEDLYAQILNQKSQLIKEGKIKKEKPLPDIAANEIPFEIPKNWKWVHLGEIFEHNTGKALNSSDKDGELLEYITTSNMYWEHFELVSLKKMFFKESEIEKCTIKKGDLLICEGGDIGRSAIWDFDYEMRIQNHIHKLRGYGGINHKYYYYMMWNYKNRGIIDGRGIGLQGFSSKRVHSLVAPLPPIDEQNRIVERIDSILEQLK